MRRINYVFLDNRCVFFGKAMWLAQYNAVLWGQPFIITCAYDLRLVHLRQRFVCLSHGRKKAPATRGYVAATGASYAERNDIRVRPYPLCCIMQGQMPKEKSVLTDVEGQHAQATS